MVKKVEFWGVYVPDLFVWKWALTFYKKKYHISNRIPGGPEKKLKWWQAWGTFYGVFWYIKKNFLSIIFNVNWSINQIFLNCKLLNYKLSSFTFVNRRQLIYHKNGLNWFIVLLIICLIICVSKNFYF